MRIRMLCGLCFASLWFTGCATTKSVNLATGAGGDLARLEVPPALRLTSLDDQPVSFHLGRSTSDTSYEVDPGPHTAVLIYDVILDTDQDSGDYIKYQSPPVSVQWTADAGGKYRVEYIPVSVNLRNQVDDSTLRMAIVSLGPAGKTAADAPAVAQPAPAPTPVPPPAEESAAPKDSDEELNALKDAWNKANAEERKAFLNGVFETDGP